MKHAQRKSRIRSRPDRNPFVSFTPGVRSHRVDGDHLHASGAGVSHIHGDVVESPPGSKAKLSSYQNGVFAVVKVGLLVKAAAGQKLHRMNHLAAGGGSVPHEVGSAEGAAESH